MKGGEEYMKLKSIDHKSKEIILEKIAGFKYVSFDVFDTVLKRNITNPIDVFELVNNEMRFEIENFTNKRVTAEKKARASLGSDSEEVTIQEIYNNFSGLNSQEVIDLIKLEEEIELIVSTENKIVKEIYDWCIKNHKMVIFISDMYLSKNMINEMLIKSGYNKFENLYVSSEEKLRKSTGSLFKHVLDSENINATDLVHIGDSKKSDYIASKKIGIQSILIPRSVNYLITVPSQKEYSLSQKIIDSYLNNNTLLDESFYSRYGYETLGPLLFGFTKWLRNELEVEKIKKVYFFSRDGLIMMNSFNLFEDNNQVVSKYLYGSRRSYRIPQIWLNPELTSVIETFPQAKLITIDKFFGYLGLNGALYTNLLTKLDINLNDQVFRKNLESDSRIIELYENIKNDVINNSKKEYSVLKEYLRQECVSGKIAVVDIGWRGSLQLFIQQLTDEMSIDTDIYGYYIGLHNKFRKGIKAKGYFGNENNTNAESWKAFIGLAELMFTSQEGSVEKFKAIDSNVIPVLYNYEYVEGSSRMTESRVVEEIQSGALRFVRDFSTSEVQKYTDQKSIDSAYRLVFTGMNPSKEILNRFGDFRFEDDGLFYLAKPKKIREYLQHPKWLLNDLMGSRWKIGYLKKLIKIPFGHKRIYLMLKKMSD